MYIQTLTAQRLLNWALKFCSIHLEAFLSPIVEAHSYVFVLARQQSHVRCGYVTGGPSIVNLWSDFRTIQGCSFLKNSFYQKIKIIFCFGQVCNLLCIKSRPYYYFVI
jgi:hypothetical protein